MDRLSIDAEKADKILAIQSGETDPETYKSVSDWVNRCYNRPSVPEMRLYAFNEILEGHGVEGGCVLNGDAADYSYVNMGDTYTCTILHDCDRGTFRLMSWGDFVEQNEGGN